MKYAIIILSLVSLLILSACAALPKACTMEAKLCPDGSSVGRTGPNCEFSVCPVVNNTDNNTQNLTGGRTYINNDSNCKINFMCIQGTQAFHDANGCGCEPIPPVNITQQCEVMCAVGYHSSSNGTNCSCVPDNQTMVDQKPAGYLCTNIGGNYDQKYKECTGISKDQCDSIDGTFNECASACRHDPTAQMCTLQCVIVCQLH